MRLTLLLFFLSLRVFAQVSDNEINQQVWKPFIASFNAFETDKFMALHSKDLVRSPRDARRVMTWDEYYKEIKGGNDFSRANHLNQSIELRFTERISTSNQAIEVGIYKTSGTDTDGKKHTFYGRFHVVLRKEKGVWKILVDTDSSEGESIDEKAFAEAKPME